MKRHLRILALLTITASCKPVELKQMNRLGRTVVMHTDSTTVRAETANKGLLVLPKIENTYYWFENGRVNHSQGAYSGKVLHGSFRVYSLATKRPLESGRFRRGLKNGRWLSWGNTGLLSRSAIYHNGQLQGPAVIYDSLGRPADTIKYRHGHLVELRPTAKKEGADSTGLFGRIGRFLKFRKK